MRRAPALLALVGAAASPAAAQQLAFPGAEGAGRFSGGARANLEEYLNGLIAPVKGRP